jgi:nitric oxide reductase NorE protein
LSWSALGAVSDSEPMRKTERHVPGEPGIWLVLFGDMSVFAVLFGVYLLQRSREPDVFTESQTALNINIGAANTLVLLVSSLLVVFATQAFRREEWRHYARRLTLAGFCVGLCFIVLKVIEYHAKFAAGITPGTNQFFTYYFALTGVHLAHVVIGLGVLLGLSVLARKPSPNTTHIALFESGACFWHMVDLLWLVIFPLLYLMR